MLLGVQPPVLHCCHASSNVAFLLSLQVHLVEVDVEQDQEIAQAGGITSTPTVQMFKAKERLEHLPGVKMKSEYRKLIEQGLQAPTAA